MVCILEICYIGAVRISISIRVELELLFPASILSIASAFTKLLESGYGQHFGKSSSNGIATSIEVSKFSTWLS